MLEAQPDFDPHNLKHEGVLSPKHAHVNKPYVFEKFPLVVSKTDGEDRITRTVATDEELEAAKADGFSETA